MSLAEYAAEHGLKRVGARPALFDYLAQAWSRKDFAFALAKYSNEAANAKNRLGRWWIILLPTLQAMVYGLIFGVLMARDRPENFIPFLFTGVFLFTFMSGSATAGASAMTSNTGLVRSLAFPRILLPVSAVLRQLLNNLPQLGLLIITLLIFRQTLAWDWLLMVPVVVLLTSFNFGVAMIMARIGAQVQDINKLLPFAVRILFYTSGIFFSVDRLLVGYPELLAVLRFNPIYDFIELARGLLVDGYEATPFLWLTAGGWALGTMVLGVLFFWKAEERYGRED